MIFPEDWICFFQSLSIEDCLSLIDHILNSPKSPISLQSYLSQSFHLSLQELIPFDPKANHMELTNKEKIGYKTKKIHEISYFSPFIYTQSQRFGVTHIIDIGAGQGYLMEILASHYPIHMLGIETKQHNVEQSIKRIEMKKTPLLGSYSMICTNLFLSDSIEEIKKRIFNTPLSPNLNQVIPCSEKTNNMLLGLHACGDLSPTMIRLFTNPSSPFSTLILVTCCYGLLSEEGCYHSLKNLNEDNLKTPQSPSLSLSLQNRIYNQNSKIYGYPMSSKVHLHLGHYCRNLINQNTDNLDQKEYVELCYKKYLYRALIQIIFEEKFPELKDPFKTPIGTIPKSKINNFVDYTLYVFEKFHLKDQITIDYINSVYNKYKKDHILLLIFWLLQSPILESLIHIDRVFYLLEHGIQPEIYNIFDQKISPRSLVLVAHKDTPS